MNWLLILMFLILLWRITEGVRRGMVKELLSFISLIVLSLAVVLVGLLLGRYFQKDVIGMAVAIILLLILAVVHSLLGLVFFPAKLIAKLPLVRSLNKLLGAVVGIPETIVIVWTAYCLLAIYANEAILALLHQYIADSRVLSFLDQYNFLQYLVDQCSAWLGILF